MRLRKRLRLRKKLFSDLTEAKIDNMRDEESTKIVINRHHTQNKNGHMDDAE